MEENKFYEPKQDYKVLCHCCTYNQAQYITDTMNGFTMQKTNFPFVCYIIDDASTDGEPEIIKAYLNEHFDMANAEYAEIPESLIIIAKHKTNENCTFAVYLLKENLFRNPDKKDALVNRWREHCEYEAFCEGDDYWIVEDKLQKQVEFMDANPDYGLCFTNFKNSNGNKHRQIAYQDDQYEKAIIEESNPIGTATMLYRLSLLSNLTFAWLNNDWGMSDAPMWIEIAHASKIKYIDEETAVYRILENSASHYTDIDKYIDFYEKSFRMRSYYNELYGNKYKVTYPYQRFMKCAYNLGDKKKALKIFMDALFHGHYSFRTLILFIGTQLSVIKPILNKIYYK